MLRRIEGEHRPARRENRVGGYGVAGYEDFLLWPPEGEVAWRMAWRVEHFDGPNLIPVFERGVYGARRVLASPERGAELQVVDAPVRANGPHRYRWDGVGW